MIGFYRFFQQLVNIVRKYGFDIPFILGGNITKDAGDSFLFDKIGIDFGVLGEAETAFPGLISAILGEGDFSKLSGVMYKNSSGDIVRNSPQRMNMRESNMLPAWDKFDVDYYIKVGSLPFFGHNIKYMPVLSGRGCIGRCSFCSPTIGGFRGRPIEHVIYEITDISLKYDFDYIMFYNEMFYPTAKQIREFCYQYGSLSNRKPWITQVRVDSNIDVDTFVQMKEAGCVQVSVGIESGSDRILKLMNKKIISEQTRSFFQNATIANIPTSGTFMIGYEEEKEEDIKKTIDLIIDEEINTAGSPLYVYPGTAVYRSAYKKGFIKDELKHLEKVTKYRGIFAPDWDGENESFFNITDMSDDQYCDIAASEIRRYQTFIFNRYPVQDLSCRLEIKRNVVSMIMAGRCYECGAEMSYNYKVFKGLEYMGILGAGMHNRLVCLKCIKRLSFNIYTCSEMKELSEHFFFLKERISKRNKIVIGGINEDAMFLLRIDLLNLDYDKILGFIDFTGQYRGKSFVNYPILNIDHIVDLEPDCILLADCVSDAQNVLNKLYKKRNVPIPEILYFCDTHFRNRLKKIRYKLSYRIWNRLVILLRNIGMVILSFRGGDEKDIVSKRYGGEAVKGEYK